MSEDRVVMIGGKEYLMQFPSLGRVKELGKFLKCDVLRDGLNKADFAALFEDDSLMDSVLKLVFGPVETAPILNEVTAGDLQMIIIAFFLKGKKAHLTMNNGLNSFVNTFNQAMSPPQKDTQ